MIEARRILWYNNVCGMRCDWRLELYSATSLSISCEVLLVGFCFVSSGYQLSAILCVYVCTVYTKKVASAEQDLGLGGKILGCTIFYSHRNLIEFPKASDVWNEFFTVWESKAGFLIVPQKFHCKPVSKNRSKKILLPRYILVLLSVLYHSLA